MQALLGLTIIAFFFLLQPGEHCYDKQSSHPLWLQGAPFQLPSGTANAATMTDDELALTTTAHLKFMGQKSRGKGEVVTHGDTSKELASHASYLKLSSDERNTCKSAMLHQALRFMLPT